MKGCASAVLQALRTEIEQRAQHLDNAADIGMITISVKLQAGTTWVRGVTYQEERVVRTQPYHRAFSEPQKKA